MVLWQLAHIVDYLSGCPCKPLYYFTFFYLLKISINLVSLSGLILGVGLMIDNAIIIIENIRIWLKDHTLEDTVVKAPNEILAPMFSSSLTNIAVFAPLVLFGGIAGALFYDQALSITIALTCSVFLSYTLIPVLFPSYEKEIWTYRC
ncbi:MAG: efflux RND transporter permease subunit [Saprospiraceae bacterium]|nr:efflux RND transporter permease subunit [Saprospiraceae bacterium]